MRCIILLVAIISLATACNDTGTADLQAKEDSLFKDVMDGHDVGMAKMGRIRKSLAGIKESLDSLGKVPVAQQDTVYRANLVKLQEDLEYADMSMNTWMEEFELDSAKDNLEVRVQYLQSEKDKVTKVRDNILNSLQRADSLLKQ